MTALTTICPLVPFISDNPAQTRWREQGHLWPLFTNDVSHPSMCLRQEGTD